MSYYDDNDEPLYSTLEEARSGQQPQRPVSPFEPPRPFKHLTSAPRLPFNKPGTFIVLPPHADRYPPPIPRQTYPRSPRKETMVGGKLRRLCCLSTRRLSTRHLSTRRLSTRRLSTRRSKTTSGSSRRRRARKSRRR